MVGMGAEISEHQTVSKFAGEEFDVSNVRTVFAGASKDSMKRSDRVLLLVGPTGSNKSNLIDCMCNYFYGAKFDGVRYKIADEIFDRGSTPIKSITKYVFNATAMPFRPIIIDTPEIASDSGIPMKKATTHTLHDFLIESEHIKISALCLVLKFNEESINKDEEILREVSFQISLIELVHQ
uniref:RNA polymerase II-associated factor 1 homolog n=1 Tax=Elaeophora elaphi TaxID=1147741 RepID=A0A0R3RSC8_9BILA